MTDAPYNPNDPDFLVSRAIDGDLSPDEQRRLDERLGDTPVLRHEMEALQTIDGLIKRWGAGKIELDWTAHRELVEARVREQTATDEFEKVDKLVARWGRRVVQMDDRGFVDAVMNQLHAGDRRVPRRGVILRIGLPLAAAAAVVLAVTGMFWSRSAREARVFVVFDDGAMRHGTASMTIVESEKPLERESVATFDRSQPSVVTTPDEPESLSLLAVGAGTDAVMSLDPTGAGVDEAPPL